MAKTISKISVDTPTNVTATATSGGDLTVSTTYYYRVASVRRYENAVLAFSAWSSEVSATTDSTNKTIDLDWDDMTGADGYLIQRTETSGEYDLDGSNTLKRTSQGFGTTPCAVESSYFDDDGGADHEWVAQNIDLANEVPVILVSSDSGDTINMSDVYDADVAGSWGVVNQMATPGLQSLSNSSWKERAPYWILGGLYIKDCTFELPTILYNFIGNLYFKPGTVTIENSSPNYYSNIFKSSIYTIPHAPSDMSSVGYWPYRSSFMGDSNTDITGVVRRTIDVSIQNRIYYAGAYDSGVGGSGETYTGCLLGLGSINSMPMYAGTYNDCVFESLRTVSQGIDGMQLYGGSLSVRWASGIKVIDPVITSGANYDLEFGSTHSVMIINPTFRANTNSTNSNPYINMIVFNSSETHGICIANDLNLKVVDSDGNPIQGATVTIQDQYGNNALWEASDAELDETLDLTESSIVIAGTTTGLSVGDYIRFELNGEIMKITGLPGNIEVDRGQLSTKTEHHFGNDSDPEQTLTNRLLKQKTSLTTDANGEVETDFPLVDRYLEVIEGDDGYQYDYEDNLVTDGYLDRHSYSPYTVTISKTGYKTRVIQYDMDRKREEIEKLTEDGTNIYDSTLQGNVTIY